MLSLHHSIGCFCYDVRKVLEHLAKYFITLRAECWACLRTVRSPCAINRACLSQICFGRISTSVYLEGKPFIFVQPFWISTFAHQLYLAWSVQGGPEKMFKNTFQSGFLSILYSIGSKPLQIWDKKVSVSP